MCGIGGVITSFPFTKREAEMCVRLFASLTRRGKDAFGYFDGKKIFKRPGSFTESEKFYTLDDELVEEKTNIFLCHTRYATRGNPQDNKNNHPFALGPFVFAHNGVLFYSESFPNRWDIETDSFWLLYWINEEYKTYNDTVKAIQEGVKHIRGVYACWLYNKDEDATYIFRTPEKLLQTFIMLERKTIVFGSDWISIRDALGLKTFRPPPGTKLTKPFVIYKITKRGIKGVGRFSPLSISWDDFIYFESLYKHLYKYHRRIYLGV